MTDYMAIPVRELRRLLKSGGLDPNLRQKGASLLEMALGSLQYHTSPKDIERIEILLRAGASPKAAFHSMTMANLELSPAVKKVVRILLDHGAEVTKDLLYHCRKRPTPICAYILAEAQVDALSTALRSRKRKRGTPHPFYEVLGEESSSIPHRLKAYLQYGSRRKRSSRRRK